MSRGSARKLVSGTSEQKIRKKVALVAWLQAKKDSRVQKNPAGFLYRAITEDFALPEDYLRATRPRPDRKVVLIRKPPAKTEAKDSSDREAIDAYLGGDSARRTVQNRGGSCPECPEVSPRAVRSRAEGKGTSLSGRASGHD